MNHKNIPKEFLIKEYTEKRKSAMNIAKELKCGETTIFRALEFYKIKRRTSKENQNPLFGKEPSKEELTEMHYNKHFSINKIAKIYNTSWGNIKRLFDRYKIKTKSHDEIIRPKDYIEPTSEQLKKWLYEEKLTTTQIGKILGVAASTVRKLFIKKGISLKKTIKDRKPTGFWTKDRVMDKIKNLYKNQKDLSARFNSLKRGKLFKGALSCYGSWRKAIENAGIDYSKVLKQKQWSKQEIINEINQLQEQDINLSHKNIRKLRKDLIVAAENNFGSWAKAVNAFGLDYFGTVAINKNKYWTKEKIIEKIKELYSKCVSLSSKNMQKSKHSDLFCAASSKFGSWENAINYAGFNYQNLPKLKAQTKSFKEKLRSELTKEKLYDLYVNKGLSTVEIGILYEVSATVISNLLKKYKIELKKPKYGYKQLLVCKDGHKVKSNFERTVDDWLYSNAIEHEYEPRISKDRYFKADFKVGRFYIEILGMIELLEYQKKFEEKINHFAMQEGAGFIYCKGEEVQKYRKWFDTNNNKPIVILLIPKNHKLNIETINEQLSFLLPINNKTSIKE